MAEQYHRSQILLEKNQYAILSQIAKQNGRSISDVAREILNIGFEYRKMKAGEKIKALENLNRIRKKILKRKGIYKENLVNVARAEKELRMNEILEMKKG